MAWRRPETQHGDRWLGLGGFLISYPTFVALLIEEHSSKSISQSPTNAQSQFP